MKGGSSKGRASRRYVALVEFAPAKVNLTLRVLGRRADGYHSLDSLVAFADFGDRLSLAPGGALALTVRGPNAAAAGAVADNLVLRAAHALAAEIPGLKLGRFALSKNLPAAAGVGGGSSDAAAALRLLARANRIKAGDPRLHRAARRVGADVPVCLDPRARTMRGVGDKLSEPVKLPKLAAVLVNPGVALATKDVFKALGLPIGKPRRQARAIVSNGRGAFLAALKASANDLEAPAVQLAPAVADVLTALREASGCELARMSGSGATCFGLFASPAAAAAAARKLRAAHRSWWVKATTFG